MSQGKDRSEVLGQIKNPLVFFSLAFLVIEGIIGAVVAVSDLSELFLFASICIMAGSFLIVVLLVAWITIKWPGHLYEEIAKELATTRELQEIMNSKGFYDILDEYIRERVKEDSLIKDLS